MCEDFSQASLLTRSISFQFSVELRGMQIEIFSKLIHIPQESTYDYGWSNCMNFTDLKTVCQYLQSQKNCKFTSGHCGETLRVTVLSIVFSVIRIIFSSGSSVVDHCEVVDQVCRDTWKLSITFLNHFILVDQIL